MAQFPFLNKCFGMNVWILCMELCTRGNTRSQAAIETRRVCLNAVVVMMVWKKMCFYGVQ